MKFVISFILSLIISVAGYINSFTATEYDLPIDNENGGDPFIVEDETGCYYTFTTGGSVEIRKIKSFTDTSVVEKKTVYTAGNDGIARDIWAPEIHKIDGKWYIVSCALFDENAVPRGSMPEAESYEAHTDYYRYGFVLESKTQDIFGEYEFKGILAPDSLNNIDGTYLKKDGKLYYICSAYVDVAHQCLYIAEMENPYTLKTDESGANNSVMLSRPEFSWEKRGWWVNEGPAVLYKDSDIYIVYSASGYSSGYYSLGMLTLCGEDVMNPKSWYKSPSPVNYNQSEKDIYNAGHCSFLYRESGDVFMIYHATQKENFFESPRLTYIKPVRFLFGFPCFM